MRDMKGYWVEIHDGPVMLARLDYDENKDAFFGVADATGYMVWWVLVCARGGEPVASGDARHAFGTQLCSLGAEITLAPAVLAEMLRYATWRRVGAVDGFFAQAKPSAGAPSNVGDAEQAKLAALTVGPGAWAGPSAFACEVMFNGSLVRFTSMELSVATGDDLDRLAQPYGVKRTYDLSPLANLATAVAWGLALERVVTEWRAWHPAARVNWDINADGDDVALHVSFAIDGLGHVFDSVVSLYAASDPRFLYDDMAAAKANAAMAMAPFYVAPAQRPVNRDAALRRFADGVRR